jgi:hypothetical protein
MRASSLIEEDEDGPNRKGQDVHKYRVP